MKDIKLIIFDLDGCMVHTQPDIALAVQSTARDIAHKEISLELAGSYIGGGTKKAMERMLGETQLDLLPEAVKYFKNSYIENSCVLSKPYPGLEEVLEFFKGKVLLAVATAKLRAATENIFKKLGIIDYFDCIVCDEDMTKMKPDPECVNIILSKMNIKPQNAVMIGDMKTDVLASRAAGVGAIAVSYGYGKAEDLKEAAPDYILSDLRELEKVIEL